jgi:hypothetical protein
VVSKVPEHWGMLGRRIGFERGTAEGGEHKLPKAANLDAEGVEGVWFRERVSPSPTRVRRYYPRKFF